MKKIKILFIQPIGQFSGSLKSLEEYLKILPKNKYNFIFLTQKGTASQRLSKFGKVFACNGISKFDNTDIGYYRGFRWLILLREFFYLFSTFFTISEIKKKNKDIDIIHVNEITAVPTIFILRFFFKLPIILHVRTVFKKDNFFGKLIIKYIKKSVKKLIVIDDNVKKSLPKDLKTTTVRNIFNKDKLKKSNSIKDKKYLNIGYIGSYLKYKGVQDLIIATNNLTKKGYKIRLYLAGDYIRKQNLIINFFLKILNLDNNINPIENKKNIFNLGVINNLEFFYKKINVLCFPSYLNALGRQVFEAALFGLPSIVCLDKNYSDSFINHQTGIAIKNPGSINKLENSIIFFYKNRTYVKKMGRQAFILVKKKFDKKKNLKILESIYKSLA